MWESFGKPKKSKDGTVEEAVDLNALELKYVKAGGYKLQIELSEDGRKKSETEFRRKLKEFTSGAKPHHCLVQAIKITSPAAILEEGELIPVSATEEVATPVPAREEAPV